MSDTPSAGFRIDDLARAAGTTVRNVRAYQDRGLLPPPRRVGRAGWYSEDHLGRLRVIDALLGRGYTLANIAEMLAGFERGVELGDLIGAGMGGDPFRNEVPVTLGVEELAERFDQEPDPAIVAELVSLGLLEPEGDRYRVPSPRMLEAGAELARAGVPVEELLTEIRSLRRDINRIATRFVDLVVTHVIESHDELPTATEAMEMAAVVRRIRPLAHMVVDAELNRALAAQAAQRMGERLEQLLAPEVS